MRKVTIALIGAGQRGMNCYAQYALKFPHEVEFVAVADAKPERRASFQALHGLADKDCYADWRELLAQPRQADAILVCTQDAMHYEPAMAALQAGYHVLLEKPMSPNPRECLEMGACAEKHERIFSICHVLRFTNFFTTIKQILDQGEIGRLISIQHNENVAYWHYAHSYVRGNWRNSQLSSPMILAKSCHDMDIMLWLAGADCEHISSFGSLTHFIAENAPAGAPERCLDGCPVADSCLYYAPRHYLNEHIGWPATTISDDHSYEGRYKALQEGPYGRCVYHCDNNVVDHQVVNLEFANQVTAVFTMCAFTENCERTIKLMGTRGEIRAAMEKGEIEVTDFATKARKVITLPDVEGTSGHGGGDFGLMRDFVRLVQYDGQQVGRTSAATSVQSHLMAFAAEEARVSRQTISLADFRQALQ
ncbi:oxidoreductase [Dictyobacter alpinus]|uniref:Oxidoreductase n=1 Tax=Dictyobacter alpinus TaxID=2014873 RepID=A0A402B2N0_9CHLR|nr:Gfo/Idh/MocA family oxidoreductase [Dictyobacter alpinus]GCE25588.1 oxidoreductase [Dictyobacter alpinus]